MRVIFGWNMGRVKKMKTRELVPINAETDSTRLSLHRIFSILSAMAKFCQRTAFGQVYFNGKLISLCGLQASFLWERGKEYSAQLRLQSYQQGIFG